MRDHADAPEIFYSYTHALRHPVIIGHVAGWRLPWALSATQLGAAAATAALLLVARPFWAHLGGVGNLMVFCLLVGLAGWAARHWRVEGRSPLRAVAGFATVWMAPRARLGVRNGRLVRSPRPARGQPVAVPMFEGSCDG